MESFASPVIRFAGVEIDVRRECVRAGGVEQRLRPKTFEVLLYLIDNRGRVVTKAELFQAVWNGAAVTEDTLVQSIVEIRRALGDDPRAPEFVRTIQRVGYRMIALVEGVDSPLPIEDAEPEQVLGAVEPRPVSHRTWIWIAAGVLVVLGILGLLARLRSSPAQPASAALAAPVRVAIASFESRTPTPDLDWLRDGLPSMVLAYLSGKRELTLVDQGVMERMSRSKRGHVALLDAARRAGANRLITGRFERSGGQIRVDAQLYGVATGEIIGGSSIVSTRESLLHDVDLLSSRLAALLGARSPAASTRQADRMTDSLDAYEAYRRGVAAADGLNNTEALAQFERAIALDPQFAMAHARIGYTYAVTWVLSDRAKPYFAKALALGERLNERERLYVLGWQAIAEHDYARAVDHFRLLVARYPTDSEAYARLGRLLIGEERLNEAIEVLRRGLAVDPKAPQLNNTIGNAYSYLGLHAQAIAHHQRYVAALPDEPNAHDSLGLSYHWAGEYERALAEYEEALRRNPRFEVAIIHRANTYWQLGRNRETIRTLQHYLDVAPSASERTRGYSEIFFVQRALGTSDPRVIRQVQGSSELTYHVLDAIDRGEMAKATRLVETMGSAPGRGTRLPVRLLCYARTELARATGNEAQALEYARETLRHVPTIYLISDMEDTLGDTLAAFNHNAEAVAEYRRVLGLNANRGRTRYKLARVLESMGKSAEAHVEYEHFLRVWKTADADAPEVVDAKRRLARSAA